MGVDTNTGLLTVESKGAFFQLIIADSTVVNNIPDQDVGLGGLPTSTGFRIAGLVDLAITDAAGNITPELLTAQKITVIPVKATRRHKRTIAVDKQGDDLTTLDDDGARTDLPGRGAGFEKGDKIIILVQSSGQSGIGEIVRGLFRADIVKDRLDRLIDAQAHDPQKTVILADLRSKREDAHQLRLQRTADNAGTDFRDFVRSTVQPLQEDAEIETAPGETGQTIPEDEPVPEPPVVHIDSPSSGTIVSANDLVTVTAEAKADAGLVSVTFNIGALTLTR